MNGKKANIKTALKASALDLMARHYDQHADSYLVLGKLAGCSLKKYVVAQQERRRDALTDCRFFTDPGSARRYFRQERALIMEGEYDHPSPRKDWQKQKLYDWEEKFLMPFRQIIDEKTARNMILRIARDYDIAAPQLVWKKQNYSAEYDDEDNIIYFSARDNITLLHEMAHALHAEKTGRPDTPDHGPGFVRCVMELYNRYAKISLDYMIVSAHKRGLLGDLDERQALDPGRAQTGPDKKYGGKKLQKS